MIKSQAVARLKEQTRSLTLAATDLKGTAELIDKLMRRIGFEGYKIKPQKDKDEEGGGQILIKSKTPLGAIELCVYLENGKVKFDWWETEGFEFENASLNATPFNLFISSLKSSDVARAEKVVDDLDKKALAPIYDTIEEMRRWVRLFGALQNQLVK